MKKNRTDRFMWNTDQIVLVKRVGEDIEAKEPPKMKRSGSGKKPPGFDDARAHWAKKNSDKKAGRFVTIEGRPVFVGGPGAGGGGVGGGGGSAASEPKTHRELAAEAAAKAAAVEPEITEIVTGVVEEGGGRMEGLDFRLKTQESIESKIKREMAEEGLSAEEATGSLTDLVRYTAVFESEDLAENAIKLQNDLADAGWTQYDQKFRNYFVPPPPDKPYRGYNTVYTNAAGQTFELQFHTPQSLAVKEQVHKLYERARELSKGPERTALYRQMNDMWANFQSPPGWDNLPGARM